ncbi:MAG: hypothetical protein WB735_03660, partial [Pseudonocardiaceae bacterium]
ARSTTGGRPGSAVVGSLGVVVMASSVVFRAGQRRTTSYDGHQNRLATRPELVAAGGALGVSSAPDATAAFACLPDAYSSPGQRRTRPRRCCSKAALGRCSWQVRTESS